MRHRVEKQQAILLALEMVLRDPEGFTVSSQYFPLTGPEVVLTGRSLKVSAYIGPMTAAALAENLMDSEGTDFGITEAIADAVALKAVGGM